MPRHRDYVPQGVIPAVLLPFHDDLSIDEAAYRAHLRDVASVAGLGAITTNAHASEVASCTFVCLCNRVTVAVSSRFAVSRSATDFVSCATSPESRSSVAACARAAPVCLARILSNWVASFDGGLVALTTKHPLTARR